MTWRERRLVERGEGGGDEGGGGGRMVLGGIVRMWTTSITLDTLTLSVLSLSNTKTRLFTRKVRSD